MGQWDSQQPFGPVVQDYYSFLSWMQPYLVQEGPVYRFLLSISPNPDYFSAVRAGLKAAASAYGDSPSIQDVEKMVSLAIDSLLDRLAEEVMEVSDEAAGFIEFSLQPELGQLISETFEQLGAHVVTAAQRVALEKYTTRKIPQRANALYWREVLLRSHYVARVVLLRTYDWLRGAMTASQDGNVMAFSASLRGFIESCGDAYDALNGVASTLALNYQVVSSAVAGQSDRLDIATDLETTLLHFIYAGKKNEPHRARTARDYITKLKVPDLYEALYADLCQITHPAMGSVLAYSGTDVDNMFELWRIDGAQSLTIIKDYCQTYEEVIKKLVMMSGNSALCCLGVLNRFSFPAVQTDFMKELNLTKIPLWHKLLQMMDGAEG